MFPFLKSFSFKLLIPLSLGVFALLPLRYLILSFFPDIQATENILSEQYSALSLWSLIFLYPLVEELIFRWILQGIILHHFVLQYKHSIIGILTGALLFGIAHQYLPMILAAFIMGLFVAWVFWKTQSLIAAIYIHILNNGLVLLPVLIKRPELNMIQELESIIGTSWLMMLSIGILIPSIIYIQKSTS
ncbi:MAG: CPBP family intramembrane metalloprotease [Chitinophagales bacterium]|nr:CPBP family intramembrane metalloprotease [Chitinophagales bacterium]